MTSKQVKLGGSGDFQDIGTVGQNVSQLAGNMQSVNQILDVGLRNTRNYASGFVRVSDLVALGFCDLNGNILSVANPTVNPATTVANLPTGPIQGDRGFVTDATSTPVLAAAVGGGTNKVPVVFTGAGWVIG